MPRKLVALAAAAAAAAVSVLALAAGANASHLQLRLPGRSPDHYLPNGFTVSGSLVNTAPQFGSPAGATVGRFGAELHYLSPSSGSVTGIFVIPNGHIIVGGTINSLANIPARSLGTLRDSGTLSVIDDGMGGPSEFVFQLN